jgi:hypothetical protein
MQPNLRRGVTRLATSLAVLWFVFWTVAYVLAPQKSENMAQDPPLRLPTDIALIAGAILGVPWVVSGLRSKNDQAH